MPHEPTSEKWPRLSEQLTGPRDIRYCQSCGGQGDLERWLEHDDRDVPEPIIVSLCPTCAGRLIEPHPRLYRRLMRSEPMPGAMPICLDCQYRDGTRCRSPQAAINGGPGLQYEPMLQRVHVCRSPRRLSGWHWIGGPVEKCSGKETADENVRKRTHP